MKIQPDEYEKYEKYVNFERDYHNFDEEKYLSDFQEKDPFSVTKDAIRTKIYKPFEQYDETLLLCDLSICNQEELRKSLNSIYLPCSINSTTRVHVSQNTMVKSPIKSKMMLDPMDESNINL